MDGPMVPGGLSRAIAHLFVLAVFFLAGMSSALAEGGAVRALLVGNNYKPIDQKPQYASQLLNGEADATSMKDLLVNRLGFAASNIDLLLAGKRVEIREAWEKTVQELTEGVAIFYFSGHGIEVDGENYLIPDAATEPKKASRHELPETFVSFSKIVEIFRDQQVKNPKIIGIFILDACRANPFAQRTRNLSATRGLAPVQLAQNSETFVMYAAGAGQEALDSLRDVPGTNSLYTRFLLAELNDKENAKSLSLADLAQNVRTHVVKLALAENHPQVPSYYDQLVDRRNLWGAVIPRRSAEDEKNRLPEVAAAAVPRAQTPLPPTSEAVPLPADCEGCPSLVAVPAGRLGSVQVPSLAFGKTEVTNREWNTCVKNNGGCQGYRGFPLLEAVQGPYRENKPVTAVSWDDAQAYVKWLRTVTKQNYRLPTEVEWEYAARAKSDKSYSFGDKTSDLCQYANGADRSLKALALETAPCNDGYARETAPVATFRANTFGLHDMHGNVWEWVAGCWDKSSGPEPRNCDRVARGGSWRSPPQYLTSSSRVSFPESHSRSTIGFRVVRDMQPQ